MDRVKVIIKRVVVFLLYFIGAFVITYAYQYFSNKEKASNYADDIDSKIERLVQEDKTNRTDSEKLFDISRGMVAERLKPEISGVSSEKDKLFAASVFAGQYSRAVIVTYNYCKTLNVDISEYVTKYKTLNEDVYLKSDLLLKGSGGVIKSANLVKDYLLKYVKKEVVDIRAMLIKETGNNSLTLSDSCEYFNLVARDKTAMSGVIFMNVQPDAYKALMK